MFSHQRDRMRQMEFIKIARMLDEFVVERPQCYKEIAYELSSLNNRIYHLLSS